MEKKYNLECSATGVAGVGLLVRVVQHVFVVGLLETKRLAAQVTGIRSLACIMVALVR